MGGHQNASLNAEAHMLWDFYEGRNIWLFASYTPSALNTAADRESRMSNVDTEWQLNRDFF